ncbi:MAE_28990/MAE_18760 family HEPN-like nuclease [Mitsuaria sp. CC2]|uniref:MAE_28990/MAE_18760 family HEPN-like nuclease n=1 Tax=Mitsuaria sp. CC2 TaxID=3029186 RepID=UPI003B8E616E
MKIRSADQLLVHLDGEMAWRLKEVHELRSSVISAKGKNVDVHVRAGVAMLYAHWEGFVKGAANAYIAYLAHRADKNRDLQDCFVALGMRTTLSQMGASNKANAAVAAVTFLRDEQDQGVRLSKAAVSSDSNLNSEVFKNIADWLGIDCSQYSTRFPLLDETLLATRNGIAHGEYLQIDAQRFHTLVDEILEMLRWFKTDIENAVAQKTFLKVPSGAPLVAGPINTPGASVAL